MIKLNNNIKKHLIIFTIIFFSLILLSSCNATTKKGWFGEELRCELDDYSIAEIEGWNIESSNNSLYFYRGDINRQDLNSQKIYVGIQTEENIDIWKKMFPFTSYSTLKEETVDGLTIYFYQTKSASIYGGAEGYINYVTYAVGEKEGHTFYMANEIWNAGEKNDTTLNQWYSDNKEEFVEIFESIEIKN